MCAFHKFLHERGTPMAQASVLTDSDIRRLFRIVETTRHAERNRLAFVLHLRWNADRRNCGSKPQVRWPEELSERRS
jgi:hypothetical protein